MRAFALGCEGTDRPGRRNSVVDLLLRDSQGRGGANVTLGIPRLRELLMTAAKQVRAPVRRASE